MMTRALPLALFLLPPLVACHGDDDDDGGFPPPQDRIVDEEEPNDDATTANDLGLLQPGEVVLIFGEILGLTIDPFDGFAFTASEPLLVELLLDIEDPLADLDVCVFEPAIDEFSLCFESDALGIEEGAFEYLEAGGEFHLVVSAFNQPSAYSLEVVASALPEELLTADATAPSEPRTAVRLLTRARDAGPVSRHVHPGGYSLAHAAPAAPPAAGTLHRHDPQTGAWDELLWRRTPGGLVLELLER